MGLKAPPSWLIKCYPQYHASLTPEDRIVLQHHLDRLDKGVYLPLFDAAIQRHPERALLVPQVLLPPYYQPSWFTRWWLAVNATARVGVEQVFTAVRAQQSLLTTLHQTPHAQSLLSRPTWDQGDAMDRFSQHPYAAQLTVLTWQLSEAHQASKIVAQTLSWWQWPARQLLWIWQQALAHYQQQCLKRQVALLHAAGVQFNQRASADQRKPAARLSALAYQITCCALLMPLNNATQAQFEKAQQLLWQDQPQHAIQVPNAELTHHTVMGKSL